VQNITALIVFPWCIKPIFGYLSDVILLKIKKASRVIMFCSILRSVLIFIFSFFKIKTVTCYILFFLVISTTLLFENIICEMLLVIETKSKNIKKTENEDKENFLPIYFGWRAVGSLIGSFFGGRAIGYLGIFKVFKVCSIIPFLTFLASFLYNEKNPPNIDKNKDYRRDFKIMKKLIMRPIVRKLLLFIMFVNLTPSFDSLITFYFKD